jgi:hypothetical protein
MPSHPRQIKAERLAYWYLRLNGYLTIPNFVVHPDPGTGMDQRTDVDVLGVRFPYRSELLINPMKDDPAIILDKKKPVIVIAEVKTNLCNLNGPWTNPDQQNMHRVILAIGTHKQAEVDAVAQGLYEHGYYSNGEYLISLACLGQESNRSLAQRYPKVPQITWSHVLAFVYKRFSEYYDPKRAHRQWDQEGQ